MLRGTARRALPLRSTYASLLSRSIETEAAATGGQPQPSFPTLLPRDELPAVSRLFLPHKHATPMPLRFVDHHAALQSDLLYMTYNHGDPNKRVKDNRGLTPYVPGMSKRNQQYKKHEKPRLYDTTMRKPQPPRTHENIPELHSITLHTFLDTAITNKYVLLNALCQFEAITGKHPEIINAKSNVAAWKLREGMPVGAKVVLSGSDMYSFLDKFVELVLPRFKNWYGIPATAGDGTGNILMTFESKVMSYFPEIEQSFDRYPFMCPFRMVMRTTAYSDWEARLLLSGLQIPIEDSASKAKREKYTTKKAEVDPNEPEWMKFKRERETREAARKKK
ncbi:54S ribosomal protein L7, mitochondrial [Sorochytrium milnesiophthora]